MSYESSFLLKTNPFKRLLSANKTVSYVEKPIFFVLFNDKGMMMENNGSVCSLEEGSIKRHKSDLSSLSSKEKKDKLGERISALQQLVSPYGKTDTASVLLEAMQYIEFLQEQVKVLSAPYLQTSPSSMQVKRILNPFYTKICEENSTSLGNQEEVEEYSLRSRGLCLVPVEYTLGVAQTNGADIWAPVKPPTSPALNLTSNSPF